MTSLRRIGAIAAIGALSAAAALLTGLAAAGAQQLSPAAPAASAAAPAGDNELSQLRANQQLLQQRLDQLEQIAQVGPAHPLMPPGTSALAGSFPRSFLIPGTDTSINVGGQINLTAVYWATGGNNANTGEGTQIIGVPGLSGVALDVSLPGYYTRSRANGVFDYSIYDSRLHVETRTPTSFGLAQTVLEFDWLGCSLGGIDCNNTVAGQNGLGARLRLAYATLGGLAAGQFWSPTTDLAASPETIDTGCCAGIFGVGRQPQVQYTWNFPTWAGPASLAVALADPEDSAVTPNSGSFGTSSTLTNNTVGVSIAGATAGSESGGTVGGAGSNQPLTVNPLKTEMPDLQFALNFPQPWGHLNFTGVVHDAALEDGAQIDQHFVGYGGGFRGDVKPGWFGWAKDDIGFTGFAGDGLGRYAGGGGSGNYFPYLATNFGAPVGPLGTGVGNYCGYGHAGGPTLNGATGAVCAEPVRAATIAQWGGEVWYQHWWTSTIRSTIDFGVVHEDVPTSLVGTAEQQAAQAAAPGGSATNPALQSVNKEMVGSHINLLWSPVPFVNTGFEYYWGHRQTIYNSKGDMNAIMYQFLAKF